MPSSKLLRVAGNRPVAPGVYELTVAAGAPDAPGQFYMLRPEHGAYLLPRPISVCDWRDGLLHFVYAVVGRGTGELSRLGRGDTLRVTGPLGNGFPVSELAESDGPVALVGGGVGVAPLLLTARALRRAGVAADAHLGFRDEPLLVDAFSGLTDSVSVSTESGAFGKRSLVTEGFDPTRCAAVVCCGPTPMMRAVISLCRDAGVPVWVSLETRMACGLGACLVCTCADHKGENRRTCVDGPVFRGEAIDLDA